MINIRMAEEKDTDTIVKLLNEVTRFLHSKGICQWQYPWDKAIIENDIREGSVYVLEADNLTAGTFSMIDTGKVNVELICPGNVYLYRIALLPEYQGKGLGSRILKFSLNCSRTLNRSLYLDCWAGNNKLKDFYKKEGLKLIGEIPEEDYFISVFRSD